MVVNNFFKVCVFLLLLSCVANLTREEYKKKLKLFTLAKNTNKEVFDFIDTLAVYRNQNYYVTNNQKIFIERGYNDFLIFYSNGSVARFFHLDSEGITKNKLNPINASIGVYNYKNSILKLEFSSIHNGNKILTLNTAKVHGDTLKLYSLNKNNLNVYIKDPLIPKEWLQGWKPDW